MEGNLHISSQEPNEQSCCKTSKLQTPRSSDCTLATNCALVPPANETQQGPHSHPTATNARSSGSVHAKRLQKLRELDRIQFLKHIWRVKYGVRVAKNLCHSYRQSSLRQAQSAWKAFKTWLSPSVKKLHKRHIMNFLIFLYSVKKLSAKTILGYKNALQLPLQLGFHINTLDKEFQLLSRAQFIQRPPVPKIIPKWSINHVLETYMKKDQSKNQERLLLKTLFLTALATGNRISELSNLTRIGIKTSKTEMTIPLRPNFLYKNQKLGNSPPPITFPALGGPHPLCPVNAITTYIRLTQNQPHNGRVFLHPSSGLPLTTSRLNYWLCKAISKGDNSMKVRAHDVRKFSHSLAWSRGLSLSEITRNGFWTAPNVFINKYLIPTKQLSVSCVAGRHIIN
jgi:hypothetical protein